MIYSLPNGKVINISVEDFLALTDEDMQYLMSVDAGDHATSPFYGSAIKRIPRTEEEDELDTSIDYYHEDEDPVYNGILNIPDEGIEEFPDFPAEDEF